MPTTNLALIAQRVLDYEGSPTYGEVFRSTGTLHAGGDSYTGTSTSGSALSFNLPSDFGTLTSAILRGNMKGYDYYGGRSALGIMRDHGSITDVVSGDLNSINSIRSSRRFLETVSYNGNYGGTTDIVLTNSYVSTDIDVTAMLNDLNSSVTLAPNLELLFGLITDQGASYDRIDIEGISSSTPPSLEVVYTSNTLALNIGFNPNPVEDSKACTLTLTRTGPDLTPAITVDLSSSDTGVATVPATAILAANATTADVPVTTVSDGTVDITADYNSAEAVATASLVVSPKTTPTLLAEIASELSKVIKSGEEFTVSGPNDTDKVATKTRN